MGSQCQFQSWTHQKIDQFSRKISITNENHSQPAPRTETLELPTDYEILGLEVDLVSADMCPENYIAMSDDRTDSFLVSNTGAPRAPNVVISNITIVQLRSNECQVSFHAQKNSMLHHENLRCVFDNLSHIHLSNRRHSPSRIQWLRAKVNKSPTNDVLKCSIA